MSYVKIGVAGPVGSGKTALIEALSRKMAKDYSIGVITNDIYTKEDAQFLAKNSVLPVERIIGVETGGCPHTAIREDASMNLEAVDEMMERFPDIELLFIESGGDNLSATFSPELRSLMSDLAATNCSCSNTDNGCGCSSILWIILLLCCCCGNGKIGRAHV